MDAIPPPETLSVERSRVACDGDGGALGHPRVFLQMDARGFVDCPYCDRRYVLAGGPADHRAFEGRDAA
jgi:NADH dehydrogenase (ubiquinone) Fe-S protein 6